MSNKVVSLVMNIITIICLSLLVLSSLIVMFSPQFTIAVDYYFKVLFHIICCVFQSIAPWAKYIDVYFKFLNNSFWKAGFILLLGMFHFPSFDSLYWQVGEFVFQNVCAILVMVLSVAHLVIAIVDHANKETKLEFSQINEPCTV
ncbi:Hypothetical_protein [Hexamita inflata]|uniref:Hypothetical_protein n=1 Tax=Hexamita inflata TaxID=28002 RepID=A0AA86NSH2_9EUKA|nr:Hypothetical protein HINF_LOCUS12865 [Hexamita inflata]